MLCQTELQKYLNLNVGQHNVVVHLRSCGFSILVELMPFTLYLKFAIFKLCGTYLQKCLAYSLETLQECWSAYVVMHLGFCFWIHIVLAWLLPLT